MVVDEEDDSNLDFRLTESTPSGRTEIWKNALKMGSAKPIAGYGIRNIPGAL